MPYIFCDNQKKCFKILYRKWFKGPLGPDTESPLLRRPLGFQCNLSQRTGSHPMSQNSSIFKGNFFFILKVQYSFLIEKLIVI